MASFNIFSAEFGTHATPSMSPEQRARADRWALPSGAATLLLLVAVLFEQQRWLGVVPEIVHTAVVVFWVVEMTAVLRLTPNNLEWLDRNKIDLLAIAGGVATLPFLPEPLPGFAPLAAGLRAFDLFGVYTRFYRITPFRFFALSYLLALYVGALSFARLEIVPDTGSPPTLLESFYWASVTLPSIGYGDFSPHTPAAMVLALVYLPLTFLLIPLAFWSLQGVMDREIEDLSAIRDRAKRGRVFRMFDRRQAALEAEEPFPEPASPSTGDATRDQKLERLSELIEDLRRERP